jgi:hexokinase
VNVHGSALKHGIEPEDSIQAAVFPVWIADLDDNSPQRQLRLGFDTGGRLLEVVVLTFDNGGQLVIHAMKARAHLVALIPPE